MRTFTSPYIVSMQVVFFLLLFSGCAECRYQRVMHGWNSNIVEVSADLERDLADATTQQQKNLISSQLAATVDAELFRVFTLRYANACICSRIELVNNQEEWLVMRTTAVRVMREQYSSGSIAAYMANMEFIRITRLRIECLQTCCLDVRSLD